MYHEGTNIHPLGTKVYHEGTNMHPLGTNVYLLKRYRPSDSFRTFFFLRDGRGFLNGSIAKQHPNM